MKDKGQHTSFDRESFPSEKDAIPQQRLQELTQALEQRFSERTRELEKTLSVVKATLESTADGLLMLDKEGKIVGWNRKFLQMWGIPEEYLHAQKQKPGMDYVLDKARDPEAIYSLMNKLQTNSEKEEEFGEITLKDGRVFEQHSQLQRLDDEIIGRVWSFRDITQRHKTEEALRLRERAIEASTDGVIITSAKLPYDILYVNQAFEHITGYTADEVIGKNCRFLQGTDCDQPDIQNIRLALKEKREGRAVLRNYRKDGTMFWNELHLSPVQDTTGQINHFVGVMSDVTLRKQIEEQLVHQATHDVLTDLPNRSLLLDRIHQAIVNAKRTPKLVTVLFLDLDRFKSVNDTLGHELGDKLLKAVAKRLLSCVRETDTVARIGGDEFVLVLPVLEREEDVISAAQKTLKLLSEPFRIHDREMNVTVSIGISIYPLDARDPNALMRNADTAMYQAKELGRNNFQFYTAEMNQRLVQRLTLENGLRGALERREFQLNYQPTFELGSGKVTGVEALLRWVHPRLGFVAPNEFIPLAEEIGLINPIGQWVLKTACEQNKFWQANGMQPLRVAINLSERQLHQPNIVELVKIALQESKLDPQYLELELKENLLNNETEYVLQTLNQFKDLGIQIVLDDFGTGYASLTHLKQFPIDKLKIDQAFVQDINTDPSDAAIAQAIIAVAKSLNIRVLAEGVENEKQLEFLRKYDCDEVQGYYFSKPLNATDLMRLLNEKNS